MGIFASMDRKDRYEKDNIYERRLNVSGGGRQKQDSRENRM